MAGAGNVQADPQHCFFKSKAALIVMTVEGQTKDALPSQRWENLSSTVTDARGAHDTSLKTGKLTVMLKKTISLVTSGEV